MGCFRNKSQEGGIAASRKAAMNMEFIHKSPEFRFQNPPKFVNNNSKNIHPKETTPAKYTRLATIYTNILYDQMIKD